MAKSNTTAGIDQFFRNKDGKLVLAQFPNILISVWIVLFGVNFFMNDQRITTVQSLVLFAWAYLEVTQGESYFRRTLGGIVAVATIIGVFVR